MGSDVSALNENERQFLAELGARGVNFMIVGLSAANLQGANAVTQDIDLWFASAADLRIGEAAKAAGGIWSSGFGMMPARLGGVLGDRFDVVFSMSGLGSFEAEYARAKSVTLEGITVRVLPLDRIIASNADRAKDRAVIPALEEALAAIEDSEL